MAYDNTNTGTLFKNERKTTDKHPDYNGSATIKCPHCQEKFDMWASGWIKVAGPNAKNPGSKFLSVAYSEKDGKPSQSSYTPSADLDDDIPF